MIAASLFATVIVRVPICAQQPKTSPAERLLAASAANSLSDVKDHPWHIKVSVQAYDDDGMNPRPVTVEMWHAGNNSRTIYTAGGDTAERMNINGENYHSLPWSEVPYPAFRAMDSILHPGPTPGDVTSTTPDERKQNFGKVSLDCIMLTGAYKRGSAVPLGLFPTYCMQPDNDVILLAYNFGAEVTNVQQVGKFLEHRIPMKLIIAEGKKTVATAVVETLSSYQPSTDEFVPGPNMTKGTGDARVAGGVLAGNILSKVQPIYPENAKINHASGTVVLHAVIGRDGHVHSLRPMSSPDADLTLAAILAVRRWTYKPYILNGEPTDVDSTITINFNLN